MTGVPRSPRFRGTVRRARRGDLPALRKLLSAWMRDPHTGTPIEDEIEAALQAIESALHGKHEAFLVAETARGSVVGVVGVRSPFDPVRRLSLSENPAELVHLFVSPGHERGGIGRELVSELERLARRLGHTEVVLCSGPRYRESAWGFYDRLPGYERRGVIPDCFGPGEDAPVWSRVLGEPGPE